MQPLPKMDEDEKSKLEAEVLLGNISNRARRISLELQDSDLDIAKISTEYTLALNRLEMLHRLLREEWQEETKHLMKKHGISYDIEVKKSDLMGDESAFENSDGNIGDSE